MTVTQILINGKFTNTIFQGYFALFENRLFKIQEFISGFPIKMMTFDGKNDFRHTKDHIYFNIP